MVFGRSNNIDWPDYGEGKRCNYRYRIHIDGYEWAIANREGCSIQGVEQSENDVQQAIVNHDNQF